MLQLVVNGLAIGAIYALVSCGFVWVYNAVGAVNFAHGELVMVGAFLGVSGSLALGLPPAAALLLAVLGSAALGWLFQRTAYYPVRTRPAITFIIVSIGMSILLRNSALVLWGPDPLSLPGFMGRTMVRLGASSISANHLLIIGATLATFGLQHLFFARTRLGRQMEATAQDQEAARLMGIQVSRMIALTFVMSAAIAALAGYLVVPVIFVSADMGLFVILKAFIAMVIGGFGSIPGTLVGGIFLGVLEVLTAFYISSHYKDVFAFLLLILILLLRPEGFFGEKVGEKA
ncbi:MAG: branched-chain amino acid ABC transporter permease [Deltaproteobacteria bacterium]|nr:branched-chain amino acid ABC transporter permease [Deltaproteobacteria bacterium]MBI3076156.1 branched-chain amino acid ABC transporter permease [Deltaproteobacteria bacterium]